MYGVVCVGRIGSVLDVKQWIIIIIINTITRANINLSILTFLRKLLDREYELL